MRATLRLQIVSNVNFELHGHFLQAQVQFSVSYNILFPFNFLQLLLKMRREMRNKMEHDIQTIQDQLINEQDSASFRQIDADNMRKEFQLATFKSTKF